jgi:hypothetical protein
LLSYGPDYHELWRQAAVYVDRILNGANPADLNHLVGASEDAVWDDHAERLGRLEVGLKLKLCRLFYWFFLYPFQTEARSLGVTTITGEVHNLSDIESVMTGLATEPNGGVVVIPDAFFASYSAQIVALAERLRLPGSRCCVWADVSISRSGPQAFTPRFRKSAPALLWKPI